MIHRLKSWQITTIVFCAIIIFYIATILRYPEPWYDEPLYMSRAWSTLHPGQVSDLWAAGSFDRFEGYWTIFSWIVNGVLMAGMAVAGSPSLLVSRLVILLWGLGLLAAVYWIGKKLGGYPLAIGGVIMVALSRAFLISAHMVRPDILGAAFGYSAIAFYLYHRSRWWISALAGLMGVLAFEVHGNGAFFIPVLLLLFLIDYGWKLYKERSFWYFCLGGLFGSCIYLILHVLLYPETYRAIMLSVYAKAYQPPILTMNLLELWKGFAYYGQFMLTRYVILLPVVILALWKLVRKGSKIEVTFFTLVMGVLIGYACWVRWKFVLYEIYFVPSLQILLASYLIDFIKLPKVSNLGRRIAFVFIWTAYISISLVNIAPAVLGNGYSVYQQLQQQVNKSIHPGDTILANNIYWLGLSDHRYYSIDQISFDRWFDPTDTLANDLDRLQPDIFILDDQTRLWITDNPNGWEYGGYIYIPQTDLENYLAKNATVVDKFISPHGWIQIYRIHWENRSSSITPAD